MAATDAALLRSVTQLAGSSLEEIKREWTDDYGWNVKTVGYRLTGSAAPERLQQARALIAQAAQAAQPAERGHVVPMLAAIAEALPSQDSGDAEAWMELVWMVIEECLQT